MSTYCVAATDTTPAYSVSTIPNYAKCVYGLLGGYKGAVLPMETPGFFIVRDAQNGIVRNPADADGLWTSELDALDALARL